MKKLTNEEIDILLNDTIKKLYWCRKFYIKDSYKYQISFSNRERLNKMKTKEWDNVTNDFILHKMLKGTECIIYANKLSLSMGLDILYYYKVVTVDTKGVTRTYIRVLSKDTYVEVLP